MGIHVDELRRSKVRERIYDYLENKGYVDRRGQSKVYGDSLEGVSIILDLEDIFSINISNKDASGLIVEENSENGFFPNCFDISVGKIVDYICRREDVVLA